MKKILATVFALTLFISCALGQFKQVKSSNIRFQVKNLGINTGGTLGGLQANVSIDATQPSNSSIEATVAVNTINTDNDKRDEHLRNEDYFDVAKYPGMSLRSVAIKNKGGNNYTGKFKLTIKDKTRQIEIPFTYAEAGNVATLAGTFKINRLDFGVGKSSMVLGNEVTVTLNAELIK